MANSINANSFFPPFQPIGLTNLGPVGPSAAPGNADGNVGTSVLSGNANLGSQWQGVAGGAPQENGVANFAQQLGQSFGNLRGGGDGLDEDSRELLKKRPDLTAKDIQEMQGELKVAFKDPSIYSHANKKALESLAEGGDAKPQQVGKLLSDMSQAVGKKGGAVALDMFDKARDLMKAGKSPDEIGHLVQAAQSVGTGEKDQAKNVFNAFDQAAKMSQSRPDIKGQDIAKTAKVVGERFPGKDATMRMEAFQSAGKMMGENQSLDAKGIDSMLARGQEKGLKDQKLLNSFETQGQALRENAVNLNAVTDRQNRNFDFDSKGKLNREKTSSSANADKKLGQLGKPAEGQQERTSELQPRRQAQSGDTSRFGASDGTQPGTTTTPAGGGAGRRPL